MFIWLSINEVNRLISICTSGVCIMCVLSDVILFTVWIFSLI